MVTFLTASMDISWTRQLETSRSKTVLDYILRSVESIIPDKTKKWKCNKAVILLTLTKGKKNKIPCSKYLLLKWEQTRKKEIKSHSQMRKDMYGTWEWSLFPKRVFGINHKLSKNSIKTNVIKQKHWKMIMITDISQKEKAVS